MKFLDTDFDFVSSGTGAGIAQKNVQEITSEHLQDLADIRDINARKGIQGENWFHCASIPAVIVDKWHREGFKLAEQRGLKGIQAIMDRLRAEDMQAFITTSKRMF